MTESLAETNWVLAGSGKLRTTLFAVSASLSLCCVAVAACITTDEPSRDRPPLPSEPPGSAELLARALDGRQTPEIVLPGYPITPVARCSVEIGPRPATTHQQVLAELVARNGTGWMTTDQSFDPLSGTLRTLMRLGTIGGTSEHTIAASTDEARDLALAFFATNYDLFGLSRTNLDDVTISASPSYPDPAGGGVGYSVDIRPNLTRTPSVTSGTDAWNALFIFGSDGPLRMATINASGLLPDVALCDRPALGPDDPRVRAAVIGYHLSYYALGGELIDAGNVTASDMSAPALITYRAWSTALDRVVLQPAFEVLVSRNGLPWTFIIDAETGERITVIQRFLT